jgi:transposase
MARLCASGTAWACSYTACAATWPAGMPTLKPKPKDILGLYLNPPKHAAVFGVDEKTAIRALDRSQPALPPRPRPGPERHAVEFVRHGTVSLFAALEVHRGRVYGRCAPRHASAECVRFLDETIARHRRKTMHVILDSAAVHKALRVRGWLRDRPGVELHFTPTYASWLNQIETCLGMISRHCLRRGIFRSVPDLIHKIITGIRLYSRHARPLRWTYRNPRKRIPVSLPSVARH